MALELMSGEVRFATGNALKLSEARALAPSVHAYDCDLPEIQSVSVLEVIEAKLDTLQALELPFPVFVEDTGLEIPAMGGLPGALVKWFVIAIGAPRLSRLALEGGSVTPAVAVSAVGALVGGQRYVAVGRVSGDIVEPRGEDFGWNSIFQPAGHDRTFGELSDEDRLALSMRRQPIIEVLKWIEAQTAGRS